MLETMDFTLIFVTISAIIGSYFISKVFISNKENSSKSVKGKMREQDDYIEFLKKQMRTYKNKASNMEKGPEIDGSLDDLDSVLPNLLNEFTPYAPKWLKPFLGNPDMQKWLLEYATKNPEKVQGMIGKIIKKKGVEDKSEDVEINQSV